jgi:GlpG protein
MRQLATLPDAETARTLADYLLTREIDTHLDKQPDGWAIWIRDEDHLPRARQELEEFQRNPADPRYQSAGSTADMLRKQKQREEKAFHRRQERFYARMGRAGSAGRVTVALIVISGVVFVLQNVFSFGSAVVQELSLAPYKYVEVKFNYPSGREEVGVAVMSPGLQPILHGQMWRLVTPIFLHSGIWHLVFNMWWLSLLGGAIERGRGRLRYLLLVLVLAATSNLVQYFFGNLGSSDSLFSSPRSVNFGGMSGVVYGLFGYIWMKTRFEPELGLHIDSVNITLMVLWFFLCMTPWVHFFIDGKVANAAHAGGLLVGMLLGYAPIMWQTWRSN